MAVNWFEGGRRISKLLMAVVALGGAAYVAFASVPMPTLSIRGPTMPWFVNDEDCKYPSLQKPLWNYDWGGGKPGLLLCFMASSNGQIPYAVAPTPPEEKAREARQQAEDRERIAHGEPPPLRFSMPWFYTANQFDDRVDAYVNKSVADLKVSPELRQRLKETRSAVRWRAYKRAFNDAAPWVLGICAFIWVFTAVMGWIIRGFAGVPSREDFKPRAEQE